MKYQNLYDKLTEYFETIEENEKLKEIERFMGVLRVFVYKTKQQKIKNARVHGLVQ